MRVGIAARRLAGAGTGRDAHALPQSGDHAPDREVHTNVEGPSAVAAEPAPREPDVSLLGIAGHMTVDPYLTGGAGGVNLQAEAGVDPGLPVNRAPEYLAVRVVRCCTGGVRRGRRVRGGRWHERQRSEHGENRTDGPYLVHPVRPVLWRMNRAGPDASGRCR